MNPNECLDRIRVLAKKIFGGDVVNGDEARELAELVNILDGWLKAGGLLPLDWMERK